MREILFKAKRVKNGEWIEGSLIDLDIDSGYCYIVPPYKGASTLPIGFFDNRRNGIGYSRNPLPVHGTLRQEREEDLGK